MITERISQKVYPEKYAHPFIAGQDSSSLSFSFGTPHAGVAVATHQQHVEEDLYI